MHDFAFPYCCNPSELMFSVFSWKLAIRIDAFWNSFSWTKQICEFTHIQQGKVEISIRKAIRCGRLKFIFEEMAVLRESLNQFIKCLVLATPWGGSECHWCRHLTAEEGKDLLHARRFLALASQSMRNSSELLLIRKGWKKDSIDSIQICL